MGVVTDVVGQALGAEIGKIVTNSQERELLF